MVQHDLSRIAAFRSALLLERHDAPGPNLPLDRIGSGDIFLQKRSFELKPHFVSVGRVRYFRGCGMTQTIASYELDGAFDVLVLMPTSGPITSLVGGTAVAYAQGADGVLVTADSCTITAADTVCVQFGSDDLDEGVYSVQVRVTMPGNAPRTVADLVVTIRRSIRP
jgi:hypothetical protein